MTIDETAGAAPPTGRVNPPTIVFLALLSPFGIPAGYLAVTLEYLLRHGGVSVAAIATMTAVSFIPQTWKVAWAPIVDTTLTSKAWYVIGAVLVAGGILWSSILPDTPAAMPMFTVLVVITSFASTLCSMASETFMANLDDHLKGMASGWSQAGNFAGAGLGGGLALWLAVNVHPTWVSGAVLGGVVIACCLALFLVREPPRLHRRPNLVLTFAEVGRDVWSMIRSRAGILVIILMLLPIGTGAAQNLWSAVAGDWHAGSGTVELANGALAGLVSIPGCLIGGWICDRIDRRLAYCLFGLAAGAAVALMALAPRTPAMYAVVIGACYTAYSAVVLETIGQGAAATKFNFMASISNMPIAAFIALEGGWHDKGGASMMLYGEALAGVVSVLAFGALAAVWRARRPTAG
jgi:PAT family beta-lactamase induction signal transducer AmpG